MQLRFTGWLNKNVLVGLWLFLSVRQDEDPSHHTPAESSPQALQARIHTSKTAWNWDKFQQNFALSGEKARRSCRSESAESLDMNSAETGSWWDHLHATPLCSQDSREMKRSNFCWLSTDMLERNQNYFFCQSIFFLLYSLISTGRLC